jgi:hypothetical protein
VSDSSSASATSERDIDRFYNIGRNVVTRQDRPPTPIHIDVIQDQGVMVGTLHWTWRQSGATAADVSASLSPEQLLGILAHQAQTLNNPINSLVAALRSVMRECIERDVIPIGLHLHTTHAPESVAFLRNDRTKVATVDIAVTVLPQKWVQQHAAMSDDRPPGDVSTTR